MAKKAKAQAEIDINAVKDGAEARTNLLKEGNVEYYIDPTTKPPYLLNTWYSDIDLRYSKPYTMVAEIEFKGATDYSRIVPYLKYLSPFTPSINGAGEGYKGIYVGRNHLKTNLDTITELMFFARDSQGNLNGTRPLGELKVKWICLYEGHLDNPPLTYMPSKSDLSPLVKMVGTKIQIDDQPAVDIQGKPGHTPQIQMVGTSIKIDDQPAVDIQGKPGKTPVVQMIGTSIKIDDQPAVDIQGKPGKTPVVQMVGTSIKIDDQPAVDLQGQQGAQGYTFRSRGEHVYYPTVQYRWDDQHRDWVTHVNAGKVEAYQVKKLGTVPGGLYITNSTWWERNDELLQQVSVDSLVGTIKPAKIRGSHITITSTAQSLSLARALSGGANPDNHPLDIDTIYVYSAVVAGGSFVPITLPNPSGWLYRTLRVYRATYMQGFCGVGAVASLSVYHGSSTTATSARRIISSGTVNIGSRVSDNWQYASSDSEVAVYHLERDSSAGVNHAAVDSTQCSGTMEIYDLIGILDPDGNPAWLHTNVSELTAKIGKGDWDTLKESVTDIEDIAHESHDWMNAVGTAKKSPRLAALVIDGTYTTKNSYIIDGQFGHIEWEGNSGRNGIVLADSLPVGFSCEVQNNSSLYDLAIGDTVVTNINAVPKRTIVRIRKLQSGLLVTIVASLSATITSKI